MTSEVKNLNLEKLTEVGKKAIKKTKKLVSKKTEEDKEFDLKPLEIGFKVESKFEIYKRDFRKKTQAYLEELKISGFFSDTWMWNLVFLNLFMFFVSLILIAQNINNFRSEIGINTNDDQYLDFVLNKNFLFFIPAFHLILATIFLIFGSKSQKKLNYLFISSFFQMLVVVGLELLALKNFIVYFV